MAKLYRYTDMIGNHEIGIYTANSIADMVERVKNSLEDAQVYTFSIWESGNGCSITSADNTIAYGEIMEVVIDTYMMPRTLIED